MNPFSNRCSTPFLILTWHLVFQCQTLTLWSLVKGRKFALQSIKTLAVQTLTPRDFSIGRNPTSQSASRCVWVCVFVLVDLLVTYFVTVFLTFLLDIQSQRAEGLLPGSGDTACRAGWVPANAPPERQGQSPWQRPPWNPLRCHSNQHGSHQHLNRLVRDDSIVRWEYKKEGKP